MAGRALLWQHAALEREAAIGSRQGLPGGGEERDIACTRLCHLAYEEEIGLSLWCGRRLSAG